MSTYIGKRVSYPCHNCGRQCTINAKTVEIEDGVLCGECSEKHREVNSIISARLKCMQSSDGNWCLSHNKKGYPCASHNG